MKATGSSICQLYPRSSGWQLVGPDAHSRSLDTLEEASQAFPKDARIHLALPTSILLLERMSLPSSNPAELDAMAKLQLEKTLPYPIEEAASATLVIATGEPSSAILSIAVRLSHLDEFCSPLLARGATVEKATPFAASVAAACAPHENVLCVYRENGHVVSAISNDRRLAWAHCTPAADAESFSLELPRLLLGAELAGASTEFTRIRLDRECGEWEKMLKSQFQAPVEYESFDSVPVESSVDLTPKAWLRDAVNLASRARTKRLLALAGAAYLAALALAFAYVGWLKIKAGNLDAEYATIRPKIEALQASQARWNSMAPAIDPDRATVELLYQLCRDMPKTALHLTEFDQSITQWKVLGEADSPDLAVQYLGKLKEEKELSDFSIAASPPSLLPNGSAQFSIFGKR